MMRVLTSALFAFGILTVGPASAQQAGIKLE